ncbi:hypothetical protein QQ045_000472 [Rhodiola kirilowii]
MTEMTNLFVMNVVVVATAGDEDDASSSRQSNRQRQRGSRGQNLLEDYFVDRPIFSEVDFRERAEDGRRILAYGSCVDQCAELTRMGESTTLECLKKWCAQVVEHYGDRYLRSPDAADLS